MIVSTILIVDDDTEDQELFCEAVREVDASILCLTTNDGAAAMRMLQTNAAMLPDIIFLDLNMPRLNGKQCLVQLKQSKELCHIPVIIYSTSRQLCDVEEIRKLGAAAFISKPSSFEGIMREISLVLKTKWSSHARA